MRLCQERARKNTWDREDTFASLPSGDGTQIEQAISPESAPETVMRGTVCSSRTEADCPSLARLASVFRSELPILDDVAVNCYVSSNGNGYPIHYDVQDIFVLQIHGAKEWRYSAYPAVRFPPDSPEEKEGLGLVSPMLGVIAPPVESNLEMVTIRPGDLLYLPAGAWHRARAIGTSLALTVNCSPFRVERFFLKLVRERLLGDIAWRARMPGDSRNAAHPRSRQIPPTVHKLLHERLQALAVEVASISVSDLEDQWYARWESASGGTLARNGH